MIEGIFDFFEYLINSLDQMEPIVVYLILFFFAFIENVFPPSPSDVVVIVGAALPSLDFVGILFICSIGSALGFILMYYVGKLFGEKILLKGKIKFISQEGMDKTNLWFNKYGYWLISVNRFLPGTRSLISFFSGINHLNVWKTFLFASISAFTWNGIIIYLGKLLGNNLNLIKEYLNIYSYIFYIITAIIVIFFVVKFIIKKRNKKNENI
ncbi:MAG: DedA family protein [Ignavibacteriales bacterium]|nr:DedA family protein [Ignavibacteriales bacterium]